MPQLDDEIVRCAIQVIDEIVRCATQVGDETGASHR